MSTEALCPAVQEAAVQLISLATIYRHYTFSVRATGKNIFYFRSILGREPKSFKFKDCIDHDIEILGMENNTNLNYLIN